MFRRERMPGCQDDGAGVAARRAFSVGWAAERLAELSALVERLVRVMEPTYVPVWMRKPIPLLDDDKPLDVIAVGEYRRVSKVVAGLDASGAV